MGRNHSCWTLRFFFVSAMFSWVIFRSVSSRTISALGMDEAKIHRFKRHDYGDCKCFKDPGASLYNVLTDQGQELFKLKVDGVMQDKINLTKCLNANARCGDSTADREGRPRYCRQKYFKPGDELITIGLTDDTFKQHLKLDFVPNGCECVDPLDSWND